MKITGMLAAVLTVVGSMAAAAKDQFTPIVVAAFTPSTTVVRGSDGKLRAVYELVLSNTRSAAATLREVSVLDAAQPDRVLRSFAGDEATARLRDLNSLPPQKPQIELSGTRLFLIDLTLAEGPVPAALTHRITFEVAGGQPGVPTTYVAAPVTLAGKPVILGSPLAGEDWVAFNGCCRPDGAHRGTALPVNGELHFAQRFAIDWMKIDARGRIVTGDVTKVEDYTSYGIDVLAVADGTVVEVEDDLPDQLASKAPDRSTITIDNVDGNHVVLDIGDGRFAFYAHMIAGSVTVKPGDKVRRGQVLGRLGNSGNTTAPHLHFHVMDGPSVLGSEGMPFVLEGFGLAGNLPEASIAPDLSGDYSSDVLATPARHEAEYPLDLNIVDFNR